RLYALAQAVDAAEHRDRWRSRRRATPRRLCGRRRASRFRGVRDVRDRLRLDAATLLGPRAHDQGALRTGEGADAAGRERRCRDLEADRALHDRADRSHPRTGRARHLRARVRRFGARARSALPGARRPAAPHPRARCRREALLLLTALPRAALRRDGRGLGDLDGRTAHRRRDRPQEHALGLGALRTLLPALRRHRRRRARLPLAFIEHIWITELGGGAPGRRLARQDLFDTAGVRTTYGSVVFDDHVPTESAEAVELLKRTGWAN